MAVRFDPSVLANDPVRRAAILDLFTAALDRVDPYRAVARHLDGIEPPSGRLLLLALGKAAPAMARAVADRMPVDVGIVVSNHPEPLPEPLELIVAGHPLPDDRSVAAARRLLAVAEQADAADLLLCLISGGGSALAELPAADLSLRDIQDTVRLLLQSGARIEQINTVRTHLSAFKGGRLAQAARPAKLVTLVLSDIVGSPVPFIASGPTVADPTTYADALTVLDRFGLVEQVPEAVRRHLRLGVEGRLPETSKIDVPGHEVVVVADGAVAARGVVEAAEARSLSAKIATTTLTGEAAEAAVRYIERAGAQVTVFAGETTVRVDGDGVGGRNQEAALAAARHIAGRPGLVFATLATDGVDGPTDAAGAIVDGWTVQRGTAAGLDIDDHLARHDAYPYLATVGDLLTCGPTGTNVGDVWVVMRG